jgi:hypothetical protein
VRNSLLLLTFKIQYDGVEFHNSDFNLYRSFYTCTFPDREKNPG